MKQLLFVCAAVIFLFACNSGTTHTAGESAPKDTITAAPAPVINYPYTANYSSQFQIGDPQHAKTVLEFWQHWDNNTLDQTAGIFADSVSLFFSDGTRMHLHRDSMMVIAKHIRSQHTSVTSTVDAWVPLKSTDKNENWVCMWGKEVTIDSQGKKDSTQLQENWKFDKNGKVAMLIQFSAKPWQ